jgi:hypothetical protein
MNNKRIFSIIIIATIISSATRDADAQNPARARDIGIPFKGTPGHFNAITGVKGVEVGLTTIISGEGNLKVSKGPVRTGVTAILPTGKPTIRYSPAGIH